MYNDNVMKWAGPYSDSYDEYEELVLEDYDVDDEVYDDSQEWYNKDNDGE